MKKQVKEKAVHDEDGPVNRRFSRILALRNALFYQVKGGLAVAFFNPGKTEEVILVDHIGKCMDSHKRATQYNFLFNHN
jgi:hypothetical protein